jgi:hypothetical protein
MPLIVLESISSAHPAFANLSFTNRSAIASFVCRRSAARSVPPVVLPSTSNLRTNQSTKSSFPNLHPLRTCSIFASSIPSSFTPCIEESRMSTSHRLWLVHEKMS